MKSQAIDQASLILTSEGRIYHLNLLPGELAQTIILVGDPDRVSRISHYFDRIEHRQEHREFITHTGYINKLRLSVIATGIGTDNVDIVLNEIDALWNIDFESRTCKEKITALRIIRLGTAGSLSAEVPVDDLVFSDCAVAFDGLLNFYQPHYDSKEKNLLEAVYQHFKSLPMVTNAYVAAASERLAKYFSQGCHRGITLTNVGFYGPQHRQLRMPLIKPDVLSLASSFSFEEQTMLNFEMETAAVLGLGRLMGHDCCSISAVVANRITQTVTKDPESAVDKMIEKILPRFKEL